MGWSCPVNQIHYTIETIVDSDDDGWDGRTACPPEVGDQVLIGNERYIVVQRIWRTAAETLGDEAARAWGHAGGDHVHVTLRCEKL